jgi:hypothetical protein
MQHTEAYALLWLASGARYERIDVSGCAAAVRRTFPERVFTRSAGGVEQEGAGERIRAVLDEAIDNAEKILTALAKDSYGYVTPEQCVEADAAAETVFEGFTIERLWGMMFEGAGAATAGMWRRSGEVFPSEEVSAAVATVLHDHGFKDPPLGYQGAVDAMETAAYANDETPVEPKGHGGVGIPDRSRHKP